jgi:hypothetical protein
MTGKRLYDQGKAMLILAGGMLLGFFVVAMTALWFSHDEAVRKLEIEMRKAGRTGATAELDAKGNWQ